MRLGANWVPERAILPGFEGPWLEPPRTYRIKGAATAPESGDMSRDWGAVPGLGFQVPLLLRLEEEEVLGREHEEVLLVLPLVVPKRVPEHQVPLQRRMESRQRDCDLYSPERPMESRQRDCNLYSPERPMESRQRDCNLYCHLLFRSVCRSIKCPCKDESSQRDCSPSLHAAQSNIIVVESRIIS